MKKIFRAVAALAVVMFAGCTNDLTNDVVAPVGEGTTVTLGLDTKTSLGELVDGSRKVYWSAGDQININGNTSKEAVIDADNAGLATFSFGKILNTPYSILYPAEDYKDPSTITLPAVQAAASGSFGVDAAPMAAYVTAVDETPLLLHLTAVVRLQIKAAEGGDACPIRRIEFRGGGNEQVSGDFAIDYQTATLTATSTAVADQVVTARVNESRSTEAALDVFIVVPAQEYAGFTVRVIDESGHYMEKSSTATIELAKGQIVAMPEFPFEPTGTQIDTELSIASATEWNTFVKEYNEGKYEGQHLDIKLTADLQFDDATNEDFVALSTLLGCHLDGQSHAFKGLKATCPIFNQITSSVVKNVVVDETCETTYSGSEFDSENEYYSVLANNLHRAEILNCTINANLTMTDIQDVLYRNEGTTVLAEVYVGGVFARTDEESSVSSCIYGGKIETKNDVWAVPAGSRELFLGGIVGYSRGALSGCSTTAQASIVSAMNIYQKNIGGIVGRATGTGSVTNCMNEASIKDESVRQPNAPDGTVTNDHNRRVYMGGVVGMSACAITGCTNKGALTANTNVKQLNIGGVLGIVNTNDITFSNNHNTGELSSTGASRYPYIGSLIGHTNDKKVELDLLNCTISGNITISNWESNTSSTTLSLGGVVGHCNTSKSNLVIKNATYTGKIEVTNNGLNFYKSYIGGIVACAPRATLENCTYSGEFLGHTKRTSQANGTRSYVGGIVGQIFAGTYADTTFTPLESSTSTLTNCDVTSNATIKQWHYNNNTVDFESYNVNKSGNKFNVTGGIIGDFAMEVAVDNTTNTLELDGCDFAGKFVMYRSLGGGIIGRAFNATIENCTVTGNLLADTGHPYTMMGGVVGLAQKSTFTNCSCKSNITAKSGGSCTAHAGGIAAYLWDNTTISNCSYNGTLTDGSRSGRTFVGGIAAEIMPSVSTIKIENCKLAGTVQGTVVTTDNVASLVYPAKSTDGTVTNGTATVTGTALYTE